MFSLDVTRVGHIKLEIANLYIEYWHTGFVVDTFHIPFSTKFWVVSVKTKGL